MKTIINEQLIYEILTRREIQITKLILDGFTDKEISEKLYISYNTVRTHHRNILRKVHQHNMTKIDLFCIK